jgi:dTDP-4-amino-4,6-dideoxygalactose transaminase
MATSHRPELVASVSLAGTDRIVDAMARIQETNKGIVLLLDDDGVLVRVFTDGDLRRQLLQGRSLDAPLAGLASASPRTAPAGIGEAQALALMDQHAIDELPIVDAAGRPVDLLRRGDLASRIFLSTPHIGEDELAYVAEAFRTNWVAPLGPNVDAFERELAAQVGIGHAAAMSSGTAAIHVALRLLGVGPGDRVLCSSLTFVASVNPVLYLGGTPVFVDSEPASWNMSPGALERALEAGRKEGRLPKAAIVVDLYGQSADMDAIVPLCEAYGVPIVEDAAESLGATYKGRQSGTFGRIGIYSFNGNKIITTSGGGMLVADDEALVVRARKLSTQAREPAPHYEHVEVGYNYRMSNVLAGIGRGQLNKLDERVAARRAVFDRYAAALADVGAIEWMPEPGYSRSNRWLTACALGEGIAPIALIERLSQLDIEARPVWKPMHRQPLFAGADYFSHGDNHDCAGDLFDRGLCLPSGSNMTEAQIDRVAEALRAAIARCA